MWMHPQGNQQQLVDGCRFEKVQEHSIYMEWPQKFHVRNSVFYPTGGNAIQVVSRGGHVVEANYQHGNRLNQPAGLNGWALIESSTIYAAATIWSRNSSEINISGFLGPLVIRDVDIHTALSGVQIGADTFKGAWLANGDDVPWDEPVLWRYDLDGPPPDDLFANQEVWIDNITISRDTLEDSQRGALQLSGAYAVHINRFTAIDFDGGGNWAIRVNNDSDSSGGGGIDENPRANKMRVDPITGLPAVYFYDVASVLAHQGSIAYWDKTFPPDGKFVAFTYEELSLMTVGGLP